MEVEGTATNDDAADPPERVDAEFPAHVAYTPEQEELRMHGLRILARMIVRAYLQDQDRPRSTASALQVADTPNGAEPPLESEIPD